MRQQEDKCHRCGHTNVRVVNGVCRILDKADIYSRDCGCVTPFHKELKAIERIHVCPRCSAACLCKSARDDETANCTHECQKEISLETLPADRTAKVLGRITQTNPDVLMLPVLRNGEIIGKMSLRRAALPTKPEPFQFAIGYRIEEGKLNVYEVTLVEVDEYKAAVKYLKRLVAAGITFCVTGTKDLDLQPLENFEEIAAIASTPIEDQQ